MKKRFGIFILMLWVGISFGAFRYLSTYDANGVPTTLETRETLSSAFLDRVNNAFPEKIKLTQSHPEYISNTAQNNLFINQLCNVYVVFIHEGAGYTNSLGYFAYNANSAPQSSDDFSDMKIIFPNASYLNSGGGLRSGDKVHLGIFNPGTVLGFFIAANGWHKTRKEVTVGQGVYYTLDYMNPENNTNLKPHCAILYDDTEQALIMGMEDLRRDGNCDHDFNDVMFKIEVDPITAVVTNDFIRLNPTPNNPGDTDGDGITNTYDKFPTDPTRAFIVNYPASGSYSKLAFEDYWPTRGDYDFNDLVVKFSYTLNLDKNNKVKDIQMDFQPIAMGASYENGLAVQLATTFSVSSVTKTINGSPVDHSAVIEPGHTGETVFKIFNNAQDHIVANTGARFANTEDGVTPVTGDQIRVLVTLTSSIDPNLLGDPPYNPFLFRNTQRGLEIHLPNRLPTDLADLALIGTADDDTDYPGYSKTYLTVDNKPWALIIPNEWKHPLEKEGINMGYPFFITWALTRGFSNADWYQDNKKVTQYLWDN
jgi:LruC domain-containing protein